MPEQSSSSVRIVWLDREAVVRSVKRSVSRLARSHPEIEKVIMFGSMATGRAVPGSDVDLLMVLSKHERPFVDRLPEYMIANRDVPVDVFAYTRDEVEQMLKAGNHFVRRALAEGVTIFPRNMKINSCWRR